EMFGKARRRSMLSAGSRLAAVILWAGVGMTAAAGQARSGAPHAPAGQSPGQTNPAPTPAMPSTIEQDVQSFLAGQWGGGTAGGPVPWRRSLAILDLVTGIPSRLDDVLVDKDGPVTLEYKKTPDMYVNKFWDWLAGAFEQSTPAKPDPFPATAGEIKTFYDH